MSAEQNKAIVRYVLEEVWNGNLDVLNDHPGMHESVPFLKQLLESVVFSNREIVQQFTDGEWVITRSVIDGTNVKDFMGMPAGAHAQVETLMMHLIDNGLIVEQHSQGGRIG